MTRNSSSATPSGESGDDLVSNVGNEIKVTLDRWSVGQLGVQDLLAAAAVIAVGVVLAWVLTRLIRRRSRKLTGGAGTAVRTLEKLVAVSINLFAAALALEILGFSLGPILVIVLVVVVLALVLRPMITNLSSGLLLQFRGALTVGDLVSTAGGVVGVVQEISTRTTVIDTSDGRRVHVPNSDVLNDVIVNYTSLGQRRSAFDVMVRHDQDLELLMSTMRLALAQVGEIDNDPKPEVQVARVIGQWVLVRSLVWHAPSQRSQRSALDSGIRAVVAELRAAGLDLGGPSLLEVGSDLH